MSAATRALAILAIAVAAGVLGHAAPPAAEPPRPGELPKAPGALSPKDEQAIQEPLPRVQEERRHLGGAGNGGHDRHGRTEPICYGAGSTWPCDTWNRRP